MRLFEVQTHLTSCVCPVIKIILSISVVLVCIFRRKLFYIPNGLLNIFFSIICFILVIFCVLVLYLSIGELFQNLSVQKHRSVTLDDTVSIPVEEMVAMAKKEYIVEIEILYNKEILMIGSSADNAYTESKFRDKKFYIGSCTFDSVEEFSEKLIPLSENGLLNVLTVDGLEINAEQVARRARLNEPF